MDNFSEDALLYRVGLFVFVLIMIALIITQIIVPVFTNRPFFPTFRKNVREAELARDEALADRVSAEVERDARDAERTAEKIRIDNH